VSGASGTTRLGSGSPYEERWGYSRVVVSGPTAWTAGCTAYVDGELVGGDDAYAQADAALRLALKSLERAGFGFEEVVQARLYVVDIESNADAVGRAHGDLLGDVAPAATMVGVTALVDPRMLVEVELVAHRAGPSEDPS
jgi:enamine deaminase RidA (YjgF/YER057c/UK114 family)